jgi:hypothetical protein
VKNKNPRPLETKLKPQLLLSNHKKVLATRLSSCSDQVSL